MNRKMYFFAILFCLAIFCSPGCSQAETIKTGAYRNSIDFCNNKPLYELNFQFKKAKNKKVPDLYYIENENVSEDPIDNDNSIWGIYDGIYFYLNADRIGMTYGYIRVKKAGNYAYFKGKPMKSLQQKASINNSALMFGLSGAVITNATVNSENKDRIHYVLNFTSGMINLLTKDYMLRIMEPYGDLLYMFKSEVNNNSLEILQKYLELVNNRIEKGKALE